jgi:Contractile injection system tube protein/LysM domain
MKTPQKAKFQRLDKNFLPEKEIEVLFNPTEFTLNKGAQIAEVAIPGLDKPILQFVRGQSETLSVDLFFDSTESGMGDLAKPVTLYTDQFYQLIKIDPEAHAPPVCNFQWSDSGFPGSSMDSRWATQSRFGFQCVVESVRQRYTLFSTLGVPLRATLTVSLREYKTLDQQIDEIGYHSPDHTRTHVIQRGETLARIAEQAYDDPAQWRVIADHNGIDDPLDLKPGAVLELPPLA